MLCETSYSRCTKSILQNREATEDVIKTLIDYYTFYDDFDTERINFVEILRTL